MRTVEQVVHSALGGVGTDEDIRLAALWLQEKYEELVARGRFRSLRRFGELTIPAAITAGTVTVNRGDTTVTGDATAAAAWSSAIVGRSIRIQSNWHRIEGQAGTTLTLQSAFAEPDVAGTSYTIVPREVQIPKARWATFFWHMRLFREVHIVPIEALNIRAPGRVFTGTSPQFVAEIGKHDETGSMLVEFYPYSTDAELIHYVYYELPRELSYRSQIPAGIDSWILKQGVLVDWYNLKMARAMEGAVPNVEAAAFWRNQMNSQRTVWRDLLEVALLTDHGVDDMQFILQHAGPGLSGDIVDGYSEVYARGQRP